MSGEKTEEPTQKRLDDARKKGQLPQRKNVIEAASLVFSVLLLTAMLDRFTNSLLALTDTAISSAKGNFTASLWFTTESAVDLLYLLIAFCAASASFVLMTGFSLNNFNFAPKSLSPKFEKLNPVNGLKSLFSKSTLYNFFRLLVFFCALATLLYVSINKAIPDALNASHCGLQCLYPLIMGQIKNVIIVILVILVLLAVLDYRVQSALFRSQNKMSKDDVKNEHKAQEGDPQVKGERNSIAMNDATQPGPKDATHVVYSEELLVAIFYEESASQRPYVVAKAKGPGVARLQKQFRSYGIPTICDPGIAIDFHLMARVGQYLPPRSAIGMEKILRTISYR
jgi:type III secretion protein U